MGEIGERYMIFSKTGQNITYIMRKTGQNTEKIIGKTGQNNKENGKVA